jgi:hypothetical protein
LLRLRKLSGTGRNALLALTSSIVSVCLAVGAVELYGNYRYRQWKQEYGQKYANALETLTIASVNETLLWEYRPDAVLDPGWYTDKDEPLWVQGPRTPLSE